MRKENKIIETLPILIVVIFAIGTYFNIAIQRKKDERDVEIYKLDTKIKKAKNHLLNLQNEELSIQIKHIKNIIKGEKDV